MKINELHIKNFKNLKDVEFNFKDQKVILFLGETGNGKSSVFDALAYVLTDSLDEKLSEYIRWGQKEFEINCSFTHLNHTYDMSIVAGKTTKKLLIIDAKTDIESVYQNSEASKKLAEVIDPVLTKYSAISTQGQSTQLLFDTPSNRLKKLREILKIDKIIDASDSIKEDIKLEKEKLDKIQSEINVLEGLTFIYMDLPKLWDITKIENEYKELTLKKSLYDKDLISYNNYLTALEKYNEAQSKINDITLKIKILESDKEGTKLKDEIIFDEAIYKKLSDDINLCEITKIKYEQSIKDYETYVKQKDSIQLDISKYEKDLDRSKLLRIKPESHNEYQIEELRSKITPFNISNAELGNKLKLVNQGKCPITQEECTQVMSLNKDDIINEIENNNIKIIELSAELKLAITDKERFDKETKEQETLRQQKQSIYEKVDMLEKQLLNITAIDKPDYGIDFNNDISLMKSKLEKLNQDKKQYEEIKDYNTKITLRLNAIDTQIISYKRQEIDHESITNPDKILEPIFDIEYYNSIKLNMDLYSQKKDEYDNVVTFNKKLKENENLSKDKINVLTETIQNIRSTIRILEESKTLIEKPFSGYLIEKGTLFIKEKMNAFFQKSYGRYQITLGQDKNSVDFFFSDGVHKETPCGMASGFEKQLISIACRVALTSLQNLGIIMLDECDSESSSEKSLNLFKNLLEEKCFSQFFIISHKQDTQEYLSNAVNSGVYEIKNGGILN